MAATKQVQDAWFAGAVGRYMDPDHAYGWQCVDVADDYCNTLFGNWAGTIGAIGNQGAKVLFDVARDEFFDKIRNNPNDPNQVPQRGDIIIWGASKAVPEGHVAVVESATASNVTVIMQDGYLQYAARRVTLPYQLPNGAMVIGWLRPKLAPTIPMCTSDQVKQDYRDILEREADADGLRHYAGHYDNDFVRADLQRSQEYRTLQANKAAAAQAAADEATKQAALAAEANRLAEEKAALDAANAKAQEAAAAATYNVHIPTAPADIIATPTPGKLTTINATTASKPTEQKPSPLIVWLLGLYEKLFKKK